jgi:hypothetical protein
MVVWPAAELVAELLPSELVLWAEFVSGVVVDCVVL